MKRITGLAMAVAMLAAGSAHAQAAEASGTALSAPGGRYVFGQISSARRDQFMLDTQTGQLWQVVCLSHADGQPACTSITLQSVQYQQTGDFAPNMTPTPPSGTRASPQAKK